MLIKIVILSLLRVKFYVCMYVCMYVCINVEHMLNIYVAIEIGLSIY